MPGIIRGVARTAALAGTASAVSGRVQRRQAEKCTSRDANTHAQRDQAYPQQAQGVLTDAEFESQEAKILAS